MKCPKCEIKMKCTRTLRVDSEKTIRYYYCEKCFYTQESIEITTKTFNEKYTIKLKFKGD